MFFSAFFKNSDLLNNPIVGVMIGVLVTVLVQVRDPLYRSQLLLLGKFEYGGGPIFKVVLEC